MKAPLFIIFFSVSLYSFAQDYATQRNQLLAYNLVFSGITGGVGAVLNKKEAPVFKTFCKGFYKGTIGGAFLFAGKSLAFQIDSKKQLAYAWPSKIVHSVGVSILENSIKNEKIFSSFSLEYGFLRFELNLKDKKFIPRFQPLAAAGFFYTLSRSNARFNLNKSLQYGSPFFEIKEKGEFLYHASAVTCINSVTYNPLNADDYYSTLSHEFVHTLQASEYNVFPLYLYNQGKRLRESNETDQFYKGLSKYIYLDFRPNLLIVSSRPSSTYYRDPFEFEAESFSTHKFVNRQKK